MISEKQRSFKKQTVHDHRTPEVKHDRKHLYYRLKMVKKGEMNVKIEKTVCAVSLPPTLHEAR